MYHSGSGHTQISNFMSAIEVQGLHHKSMKKRENEVQRHIANIADQSCIESLEEEISLQKEKHGSDNDDEVSVEMKYDMAWQKRGSGRCYDSKSSVGTVIGNNTGKICGYGVKPSSCKTCSLYINKGKTPPEHTCFKNWSGSAKSMEPDVAAESIKKIETTPNVKVGTLIMDDDTTTISRIRQTVSHPVTKWSDMNHTRKHVGNNLYKVQKKHKCLTTKVIQYLQKCLTYAISQNKNNADGLSNALKRIVPHVFGQHESCDKQWCGFHANPDTYKHKSLPYGKDLSGDELCKDLNNVFDNLVMNVEKIDPAASTRDVESFNNIIASKAPKRCHYSGSGSLTNRVNCAVAQKNIGSSYVARVNSSLGISPGKFYAQHADRKDNIRKRHLIYESSKDFKKRKIEKKLNKSVKNSQVELREGATYKTCVDLNDESTHDIEEIPSPVFPPANVKIQGFDSSFVYCDMKLLIYPKHAI